MALGPYDSRHHTTTCPIPDCDARIFMARGSYAAHMIAFHNATADGFPDTGIRGRNRYDHGDVETDGLNTVIYRENDMFSRCGCGSTAHGWGVFLNHLVSDHGVTPE